MTDFTTNSTVSDTFITGTGNSTYTFVLSGAPSSVKPIQILAKAGGRRIIAGPASVNVVDREGDLITAEALQKALPEFLENNLISYTHMDVRIGGFLKEFTDETGYTHKTEVREITPDDMQRYTWLGKGGAKPGDYAFFVVAEIKQHPNPEHYANKLWDDIVKGELRAFSIAGQSLGPSKATLKCEGLQCKMVNVITDMAGSAVTVAKTPVNAPSGFEVVSKAFKCHKCGEPAGKGAKWEKSESGAPKVTCSGCRDPADLHKAACLVHGCPVHGMEKAGVAPTPANQHARIMDEAAKKNEARESARGVDRGLFRAMSPCSNPSCPDFGSAHPNCQCAAEVKKALPMQANPEEKAMPATAPNCTCEKAGPWPPEKPDYSKPIDIAGMNSAQANNYLGEKSGAPRIPPSPAVMGNVQRVPPPVPVQEKGCGCGGMAKAEPDEKPAEDKKEDSDEKPFGDKKDEPKEDAAHEAAESLADEAMEAETGLEAHPGEAPAEIAADHEAAPPMDMPGAPPMDAMAPPMDDPMDAGVDVAMQSPQDKLAAVLAEALTLVAAIRGEAAGGAPVAPGAPPMDVPLEPPAEEPMPPMGAPAPEMAPMPDPAAAPPGVDSAPIGPEMPPPPMGDKLPDEKELAPMDEKAGEWPPKKPDYSKPIDISGNNATQANNYMTGKAMDPIQKATADLKALVAGMVKEQIAAQLKYIGKELTGSTWDKTYDDKSFQHKHAVGYPSQPTADTTHVTPSKDSAVKAAKNPESDMDDPKVNPSWPSGSDRQKGQPAIPTMAAGEDRQHGYGEKRDYAFKASVDQAPGKKEPAEKKEDAEDELGVDLLQKPTFGKGHTDAYVMVTKALQEVKGADRYLAHQVADLVCGRQNITKCYTCEGMEDKYDEPRMYGDLLAKAARFGNPGALILTPHDIRVFNTEMPVALALKQWVMDNMVKSNPKA